MSEEEIEDLINFLAANPAAGELMPGSGGCRKLRWRKPGKGKSGSYRVVTYFDGEDIPIILITVFGKNEKANLTKGERNVLAKAVAKMAADLRKQKR